MTDISKVKNPDARRFLNQFLVNRAINREYYTLVPEDKFDFRMVDTPTRKSDTPRESLIHQIATQRNYIQGLQSGMIDFEKLYNDLMDTPPISKAKLLELLQKEDENLVAVLSDPNIRTIMVKVPWSIKPIKALFVIWGLDAHETLHIGWNLALMDHLGIERFQNLKDVWG